MFISYSATLIKSSIFAFVLNFCYVHYTNKFCIKFGLTLTTTLWTYTLVCVTTTFNKKSSYFSITALCEFCDIFLRILVWIEVTITIQHTKQKRLNGRLNLTLFLAYMYAKKESNE